jgi:hypothetical protein
MQLTIREYGFEKVARYSGKIVFQMAEVAVPRELFRAILEGIGRLRLATVLSG